MSNSHRLYVVEEGQLKKLEQIAKRLYTETRMSGDEMRDAAHAISSIVSVAREMPIPDDT